MLALEHGGHDLFPTDFGGTQHAPDDFFHLQTFYIFSND
jgi:hypothetical protein